MIHYLIYQPCYKNSSDSFYSDLIGDITKDINIIDYAISFVLEACSESMDG